MIPDDQVEEVRLRADIVDVIGEFVDLKKAGKQFKARCPFHEERTPSFYVTPEKGFYKCFGCGESGDVFSFLMKRRGMDFVEAVKHVAGRAGVVIREVRRDEAPEDPNRPLYEVCAFARDWFRKSLDDPETGRLARDYLEARGVDAETAERFGLGYALDRWRGLRDAAAHHGFDDALLLEAGLLKRSENAPEAYDTFRDRVTFPIEDAGGRTVAFGGRVLGQGGGGPKYVNSPETPIYHKSAVLYGLSWAKHAIRREAAALVVEGYMDVVSLAAAGLEHAVAPLGTSLTEEQASLLARYTDRVHLLFDSDRAGLKATFRSGDVLLAAGLHPAVVTLPPGEDPDTLVRSQGPHALREHLEQALDILDRKLQILEEHDWFRDIERTRGAVDRLLPTLRAVTDPTLRDIYVAKVAERTGVRRETLEAELARPGPDRRTSGPPSVGAGDRRVRGSRTVARDPGMSLMGAERLMLRIMLAAREFVERAGERIGPEDFADPAYRAIFELLLHQPDLQAPPPGMDPVAERRLEALLSEGGDLGHVGRAFDDAVARLRIEGLKRKLREVEAQLVSVPDPEERARLEARRGALKEELRRMPQDTSYSQLVRASILRTNPL